MRHIGSRAPARHRAPAPEERSLTDPQYVGSFPRADTPLDPPLPEVAFLGRSNVGTSSLLNALVGTRIAKTSGTPGKTTALTVFELRGMWGVGSGRALTHTPPPTPHAFYFLDLPGYGYARASRGKRTGFRRLVTHTLDRERLAGAVWLLDLRHDPSVDDRTMQDALAEAGTPVLAALTKSDKLPRGQRLRRAGAVRELLGLDEDQVIVTSARTGEGVDELREAIGLLLREEGT